MTPEQLQEQMKLLQDNITKTLDEKLAAQNATFEERMKPVNDIQETMEKARQNTLEQQRRAEAERQAKEQGNWKPTTWDDIPKLVDERAQEIAKRTLDARDQEEQRRLSAQQREEADLERQLDQQLAQLERSGYLPPVGNPNNYDDPGVAARRELLSAAERMKTMELGAVAEDLTAHHRNNMIFDPKTQAYISAEDSLAPLPGKYAPVGNSGASAPSNNFATPSVKELRDSSYDDLIALAERRGYGPVPTSVVDQPGGF